jgi:hypothetical protein
VTLQRDVAGVAGLAGSTVSSGPTDTATDALFGSGRATALHGAGVLTGAVFAGQETKIL